MASSPYPPPLPWTREELDAYKEYPKLQRERQRSNDCHAAICKQQQTLSLTQDIPVELRVMIWRNLLTFGEITFDAETGMPSTASATADDATNKNRDDETVHASLRVMRLSQVIHREAAGIFYGENQWRFEGPIAWATLSCFLNTISPRHFTFIKHIAIHVPFRSSVGVSSLPLRGDASHAWNFARYQEGVDDFPTCTLKWTYDGLKEFKEMLRRKGMRVDSLAERSPFRRILYDRVRARMQHQQPGDPLFHIREILLQQTGLAGLPPFAPSPGNPDDDEQSGTQTDWRTHDQVFRTACEQLASVGNLKYLELTLATSFPVYKSDEEGAGQCKGDCSDAVFEQGDKHCRLHHQDLFYWEALDRLKAAIPQLKTSFVFHHFSGPWKLEDEQSLPLELWLPWNKKRAEIHDWIHTQALSRGYRVGHRQDVPWAMLVLRCNGSTRTPLDEDPIRVYAEDHDFHATIVEALGGQKYLTDHDIKYCMNVLTYRRVEKYLREDDDDDKLFPGCHDSSLWPDNWYDLRRLYPDA